MGSHFESLASVSWRVRHFAIVLIPLFGLGTAAWADDDARPEHPVVPSISHAITSYIEEKEVAGAVTLVADDTAIWHLHADGLADRSRSEPMRSDSIFWIASMTKPITATAVLMLQDQGKLNVEDQVETYLPEFKGLKTRSGQPARLTIKHLLTHTSGLSEATPDQARSATNLASLIPFYVAKPVGFEPGSKWAYCQSGINTAARIVEVVSGEDFPAFLQKHLFDPLGMKDTTFYLSDSQAPRLAKSYRKAESGDLVEAPIRILHGMSPTSRDRFPAANGGLFSTAEDYARFCQMILNKGTYQGHRFLKVESVELMTSVRTEELKTGFTPGNGWGLGWCVVRSPQGVTAALSPGSFGHGGAYGTQAWIDPVRKRIDILMVQRENFPNADASQVRVRFEQEAAKPRAKP